MSRWLRRLSTVLVLAAAASMLTSCNPERRQVGQYLKSFNEAMLPAVQQGKVIQAVAQNVKPQNFRTTWPVLRPDVQDLQTKVEAAQQALQPLPVPTAAATVQQLATDELKLIDDMCTKGLAAGDEVVATPPGLPALRKLGEMGPQFDDLKQMAARQAELSTKLQNEVDNLKQREHL